MIEDKRYFKKAGYSRRNFLKGAGVALMLPQFASLAKSKKDIEAPIRMAFLQVPNGKIMNKWTPKELGKDYKISQTLKPLESLRDHFQVISGLQHKNGFSNGDGPGDHARAQGSFLTGVQVLKSAKKARNGISVDQVAAKYFGNKTYLPSLELSSRRGRLSGSCDSGYSCLYQFNLSWANEVQPMVPESSPEQAFNRMFTIWDGKSKSKKHQTLAQNEKSILDFVGESAKDLQRNLGKEDLHKLDQYFSSLRETEKRIQKEKPKVHPKLLQRDFSKEPSSYQEKIETLMDVMVLAFEVDATRISTMIVGDEGSNQSFPELGIKSGHHSLSHHRNQEDWVKSLEKIDLFYVSRLAYFLNELDKRKVDGKSLLEQSMIVYGSGHSDGNKHRHNNLPVILAGHGGGTLNPGQHREFKDDPMCNLYVTMLQKFGCPIDQFSDSTGSLQGI
ncbi:MAG: DUF1552 domain-containing protein [Lentisphaeraceae bacterium]|nr:DUF1552 domain-containing protein [Lentisphaeraceae bacterium]